MKNCPSCGTELKDTAKFCQKCGAKQSVITEEKATSPEINADAFSNRKRKVFDFLKKKSEKLLSDLNRHPAYSYKEAMGYFVKHKNDSPAIARGAIVLEPLQKGYQIYQVFLDANDNLVEAVNGCPLGFKQKVDGSDDELAGLFARTNVVFVE